MANDIGNVRIQPYFLKTPEFYLIGQERQRHNEAVYAYGEYAMFVLLWNAIDYNEGLVQHCPQCYASTGVDAGISEVYNQPSFAKCNLCYGTSFFLASAGVDGLGGVKARIIRPCLWNPTDESQKLTAQGEVIVAVSQVQSISDFRMRTGDSVMKADGTRWRIATHNTDSIISGFQAQNDVRAMIGYNYGQATRQDESMPAFLIPPSVSEIISVLDTSIIPNYPPGDIGAYDVINGPLIGDDYSSSETYPAQSSNNNDTEPTDVSKVTDYTNPDTGI
jgi:hypothetical protein